MRATYKLCQSHTELVCSEPYRVDCKPWWAAALGQGFNVYARNVKKQPLVRTADQSHRLSDMRFRRKQAQMITAACARVKL